MRVKSAIWVMAHVRRCNAEGAMALVARRGQEDAGAIYVKVNTLDGRAALYVPAPTGMSLDASTRCWVRLPAEGDMSDAEAEAYLARQGEFDPDLWVIEIEDRQGRHFLAEDLVTLDD